MIHAKKPYIFFHFKMLQYCKSEKVVVGCSGWYEADILTDSVLRLGNKGRGKTNLKNC